MVRIDSAATIGIPSAIGSPGRPRTGIVVHYIGGPVARGSHANCRAQVRSWHNYHKNGNGWQGIGYNYLLCHHGTLMTGRGLNRVGAHSGPGANSTYVAICFMIGGSQTPTADQLAGFRAARTWLRSQGVGANVRGHRDFMSTSCPGAPLYARVRSGDWGAGGNPGGGGGGSLLRRGDRGPAVVELQEQLLALGYALPRFGADGDFGAETEAAVKKFQRDAGLAVDGIVGSETRAALDDALEDDMPKHRRYEGRTEVELPPGSWRSVHFDSVADSVHGNKDDGGLYSLVGVYEKGGAYYDVSCGVTIQGLEPGCEVQMRATEYEDNGDGWEIVRDRPIHSPAHVGGGGHFTYAWKGNLAAGRRVRVRVAQFGDTTARITSATSDVFYWPR